LHIGMPTAGLLPTTQFDYGERLLWVGLRTITNPGQLSTRGNTSLNDRRAHCPIGAGTGPVTANDPVSVGSAVVLGVAFTDEAVTASVSSPVGGADRVTPATGIPFSPNPL
jgi:hypothetical protein